MTLLLTVLLTSASSLAGSPMGGSSRCYELAPSDLVNQNAAALFRSATDVLFGERYKTPEALQAKLKNELFPSALFLPALVHGVKSVGITPLTSLEANQRINLAMLATEPFVNSEATPRRRSWSESLNAGLSQLSLDEAGAFLAWTSNPLDIQRKTQVPWAHAMAKRSLLKLAEAQLRDNFVSELIASETSPIPVNEIEYQLRAYEVRGADQIAKVLFHAFEMTHKLRRSLMQRGLEEFQASHPRAWHIIEHNRTKSVQRATRALAVSSFANALGYAFLSPLNPELLAGLCGLGCISTIVSEGLIGGTLLREFEQKHKKAFLHSSEGANPWDILHPKNLEETEKRRFSHIYLEERASRQFVMAMDQDTLQAATAGHPHEPDAPPALREQYRHTWNQHSSLLQEDAKKNPNNTFLNMTTNIVMYWNQGEPVLMILIQTSNRLHVKTSFNE